MERRVVKLVVYIIVAGDGGEKLELILEAIKKTKGERALSKALNDPSKDGRSPLLLASGDHLKVVKVKFLFSPLFYHF